MSTHPRFGSSKSPRAYRMATRCGLNILWTLLVALAIMVPPRSASAASGDFSLDFSAAEPTSYSHLTGGGAYDDSTRNVDVAKSLEGSDFKCGDIVTYFVAVKVDNTGQADTDAAQTIEMDFSFLADTTGQSGVALGDIVSVSVNYGDIVDLKFGENTVDDGNLDDKGSIATLVPGSEVLTGPLFTAGSQLLGTVELTDLERNEQVVVRIDARIFCRAGSSPTGNLQAQLDEAWLTKINGGTVVKPPEKVPGGAQTVPFNIIAGIPVPAISIVKTVTTADGSCLSAVDSLTVEKTGTKVKYCYVVSNPSNTTDPPGATLYNVSLVDDNSTPGDPTEDFAVTLTGLSDADGDGADDLAPGGTATGEALVTLNEVTYYTNTATASGFESNVSETPLTVSDTALVMVLEQAEILPTVVLTAAGTYNESHTWDVTKTVSPVSQSAFAGDTVNYEWTVAVTEEVAEENFAVAGKITVANPNGGSITVALALIYGTISDCTNGATYAGGNLTILADTETICDYSTTLTDRSATENTVTVTLDGVAVSASDPIEWTAFIIRGSATLDDDQNPNLPPTITDGGTWTYSESYTCSTNKFAYDATTHKYTFGENNTATLTSGGFSDSATASTAVDCYVPGISKDANGTYDEVHDWEVFKTGAAAQKKFAGQSASFSWTVRVDETTHGENYLVTGDIVVVNPNPEDNLTVSLSDALDDGSIATIGPCTGGTLDGYVLTILAGVTATCDYTATPKGNLAAFATALPNQVTENLVYPGPESYFLTNISGGGPLNGTYEGWCVDLDHTINPNTNYTANVFSSYEALPVGLVEHPENFDLVNWIINYDFVGKPAGTGLGNYTYGDVQEAIWELIEDVVPSGQISHNDTRVAQIKTLAAAHEGFTPTCGDYVAVVLQPVGGQQPITIGQVTFASLGLDCAESNAVTAVLNGISFQASAEIVWKPNPINATAILDDTQNPAWPVTVSGDQTFTYTDPQGHVCPSDPAAYAGDGIALVYNDSNTATLTYADVSKSSTASTSVTCYGPIVSKTASAEWRKKYDWTITKTADPGSHTGFAGDSFPSAYDVFVDQTITDYGYLASGTISVKNPNGSPGNMTVNVADMVSGGIAATVDCDPATAGNQTSVVVAANTTKTCTYTVSLPDNTSRMNTATGTFLGIGFMATADVVYGSPIIEGYPTINVTDSVRGDLGSASGDFTFEYNRSFNCSTSASDYTNYADSDTYGNTATITQTGLSEDASVTLTCYIPQISKTAAGTYDERHEWDVEKTVKPTSQNAFAGDTVSYEWTVVVTEQVFEENFVASGTITVVNHNPQKAMTVALSDVVNGTTATISACTGDADLSSGLTVAAGGTAVCDYTAALSSITKLADAPTNNTATAVLNNLSYSASDPVEWTADVIRASATLDDDQNPAFPLDLSTGGTWTYTEQYTCSTTRTGYGATSFTYSFGEDNTAIVTSGNERDRDSASTVVACFWPQIDLTKAGDELSKIGDGVTYRITLDNNTPDDVGLRALSCAISDATIGFTRSVTLASGADDTSTKAFTIPTGAADPFVNTASVSCTPVAAVAPVVGNSTFSVSDSSSWSTNLFQPAVEIVKTGPLYAISGQTITYTFTINNLSSSDSPKLMLATLSDNVLGDLADDAPAACDEIAAGASCTFTVEYRVPGNPENYDYKLTNTVTAHYNPAGFPNDITDSDDHTVLIVDQTHLGHLTDTSFCPLPNDQFRLLYHLEVAPNIFRLQASNPGQFYFNAFHAGTPGSTFTMTLEIPYPFMTQEGAGNPIQVHDGTDLTTGGCYLPTPSLSGYTITTQAMTPTSAAGKQIITLADYTTKQPGSYTTVTVSGTVPSTGLAYVTIHLDYGLKKTGSWKPTGTSTVNPVGGLSILDVMNQTGFGSGPVTIHGYEPYNFSRTVGGDTADSTPSSYNEFKKFAGFLGFVTETVSLGGDPVANVKVQIYSPTKALIGTVYTDTDGYYMKEFKHTSKSATYTVKLPNYGKSTAVTVKANGLGAVNFEVAAP